MKEIKFKFEDLKVYQMALEFVDFSYEISNKFPDTEPFGLKSQFNRAAVSIALNIAEGSADTDKQFNRFLQIALGSTNECVVCVSVAKRQKFISEKSENEIREKLEELSKMIMGLKKYLCNKNTNL